MSTLYTDTDHKALESRPARISTLLRSRPFMLLWSAQFTSGIAGFFNYVAVAWLTLLITGSPLAVGTVLAISAIPLAVLMLVGGAVSDRLSPRTTMLGAGLSRAVVMVVMAALALTHTVQLWHLYAGAALVGTTSAFFYPASTSLLPRLVERNQLEAGNALFNLSRTIAIVLGPALSGVVVAASGPGWALAVDAAGSAIAGLLAAPLPAGAGVPSKMKNPLAGVRDGILHVWHDAQLRATLIVIAVLNLFALGAVEVGLPALADTRLAQGAVALGTAFAAWGLGSTIGSLLAATRPAPRRFGLGMIGIVVLVGAGIAAMGVAPNLPLLVGVMLVVGAIEGAGTTYLMSWMQRRTAMEMQGRVMSVVLLSSVGVEPIALAVAGGLAAHYLGLLFWASAVAIEVTAVGAALSGSVRRM